MKNLLKAKRAIFLLICIGCVLVLSQCDKGEFTEKEYHIKPTAPLSDYSSIAFIARITDNSSDWSLCTMDASGNGIKKIIDKTVACQKPVRSHSGTQLLFTTVDFDYYVDEDNSFHSSSQYELYIVNIDGTGLTLIDRIDHTEDGRFGYFAWSPDDRRIVYVRSYYNNWEESYLILFNISNKTHTILQTEGNVCSPKFSPDGKQIAYCATVDTDITYVNDHHIYKMDVNGDNNQLIIENAGSPQWSPQGNKIMFSSTGKDKSPQISVANADGSNQKQLTSSVKPGWWDTGFARGGNSDPQWTPDGKKIVYVSQENGKQEIFIMNVDGSKQTRLTKAKFRDASPEITPDGKYILFESRQSDMMNEGICVMELDGSNIRALSEVGVYPVVCR